MIKLVRMELENFGPFYKKQDYSLDHANKNMIIFSGDTGSGKSRLIEAIEWCLFGSISKENAFRLINDAAIVECPLKESLTCRITLTFSITDKGISEKIVFNKSMKIKRIKNIIHNDGPKEPEIDDFEFEEYSHNSYEHFSAHKWRGTTPIEIDTNADTFKETYFPDLVKEYYLIYGENFIDPQNTDKIKIAIERNCFAATFDATILNIETLKDQLTAENTKSAKKKERLNDLIDLKNKKISSRTEDETNLKLKKEQKQALANSISELNILIGKGGEHSKNLKRERDSLETELRQADTELKEKEKRIVGDAFKLLIKTFARDSQKCLLRELEKRVARGEIPPNIRTPFINSLLDTHTCVCGRPISKSERKILERIRDENQLGENYNDLLDLKIKINDELLSFKSDYEKYTTDINKIEELSKLRNSKDNRLNEISQELLLLKDVTKLEDERRKKLQYSEMIEDAIVDLNNNLTNLNIDIKEISSQITKIGDIGDAEIINLVKFMEDISSILKKSKDNLIDSTREYIEKETSTVYKQLFEKVKDDDGGEVYRVELNEDYRIRVIFKNHQTEYIKSKYSTGEGLILAISFLTSLRKYSGYGGPIFLDSPFSVLDNQYRTQVALNLPIKITDQLIICTRPDTFDNLRKELKPHINCLFNIIREREWHSHLELE